MEDDAKLAPLCSLERLSSQAETTDKWEFQLRSLSENLSTFTSNKNTSYTSYTIPKFETSKVKIESKIHFVYEYSMIQELYVSSTLTQL